MSSKVALEAMMFGPGAHLSDTTNQTQFNCAIDKNQRDYGQKKFIKPWRTGTKSQQQFPNGGSNFRKGATGRRGGKSTR